MMNRIIISKTFQLLYAIILVLTVSTFAVSKPPQIIQKGITAGHHIAGIVTMKPDNQPIAKALIQLTAIGNKPAGVKPFTNQIFTDEQGIWTIENVPDGDYLVVVDPAITQSSTNNNDKQMTQVNSAVGAKFVSKIQQVKMSGADIDNLVIQVNKGGVITGKVVMENNEPLPKDLIVLPEQISEKDRSPVRFAPVQADGSFSLEGVPVGEIRLKAVVYGKPKEFYAKTATVDGKDLLSNTLSIENGSKISGVHIVFAKAVEK